MPGCQAECDQPNELRRTPANRTLALAEGLVDGRCWTPNVDRNYERSTRMYVNSPTKVGQKSASPGIRVVIVLIVILSIAGAGGYQAVGAAPLATNADDTTIRSAEDVLRGSGYVV